MARVIFDAGIAGVKGKIGGNVFQAGRYGYTFKTKPIPTNPKSQNQTKVRGLFGEVSKAWGALTDAQRLAWIQRAEQNIVRAQKKSFGTSFKLAGKALFQKVNGDRKLLGLAQANTPPAPGQLNTTAIKDLQFDSVSPGVNLRLQANPTAESYVMVAVTPVLKAGTRFYKGKYKTFAYDKFTTGQDGIDVTAEYTARFGAVPLAGSNLACEVKLLDTEGYSYGRVDVLISFS